MASTGFLIAMIVAVAAAAPVLGTDYKVGDSAGWKLDYNYTAWAEGKDFRVGDTLLFVYKQGVHNVLKVNGSDFKACTSSDSTAVPYVTGNDTIALSSPGRKWYICDIADHCSKGMKFVITVSGAEGPVPPPIPGTSAAVDVSPFKSNVWMLAVLAAYRMIML